MESEKDQINNTQINSTENPQENPIIALIIKDFSDIYIRYDVNTHNI
jgi:hypothetical protein